MPWLEIIKVQTAGSQAASACRDYLAQIGSPLETPGSTQILQYHNATIDGCFMLALRWTTDRRAALGSGLAHSIIRELKRFGLVDHSVWSASKSVQGLAGEP